MRGGSFEDEFGHNAHGYFFRCFRPDFKSDGAVDPIDIRLGKFFIQKFLVDDIPFSSAADHSDISGSGFQCLGQDGFIVGVTMTM
jgi:hypothetical protein